MDRRANWGHLIICAFPAVARKCLLTAFQNCSIHSVVPQHHGDCCDDKFKQKKIELFDILA